MVPVQYRIVGRSAREISDSFESGIRAGGLKPGELLPSVRGLAAELELAPGTVAAAYKLLRDRGLVETRGRQGTSVSLQPPVATRSSSQPVEADVTNLAGGQPDPGLLPDLGLLPSPVRGPAGSPAILVLPDLLDLGRRKLADDGIPADFLTLASGGLDAIHRVLSAFLRPGDVVAIEDPGWPNALDLIAALGLRPYPVALDSDGPRPESLRTALRAGARAVIVTNRAQNPTGAFLTERRAGQLRRLLADYRQTLVIEDDHAAELAGVDLASLAGATESWAFIRSTSKPYGPDLRVALIAGDEATVARIEGRLRVSSGWVSTLLQRWVLELWSSPRVATVVANAAIAYDERRHQLIAALAERGLDAVGDTGLNVWVPVADEAGTVSRLWHAQWAVAPGARFRQASRPGVRITVSALTASTIPRLADDLAGALNGVPMADYTT